MKFPMNTKAVGGIVEYPVKSLAKLEITSGLSNQTSDKNTNIASPSGPLSICSIRNSSIEKIKCYIKMIIQIIKNNSDPSKTIQK